MRSVISLAVCLLLLVFVQDAFSQKAKIVSRACGDPSAACAKRAAFKNEDIPFSYVENAVVAETVEFYAVILKNAKLGEGADCEKTPEDFDIESYQFNFLKNKVFVARGCYSILNNYYTKIGDNVMLSLFSPETQRPRRIRF
ncbi:MAG: hypothetical protein ABL984_08510 [Pyrinomonadaceae bacterium]